ncbi:hypothetical protein ACHAWO_003990 [Cyclotella atomus]|uniref:Uncharacterized protein n=1 Tax=Cyclotella atomus TaxID=382360 RepID=A0ABD3NG80_9STRA
MPSPDESAAETMESSRIAVMECEKEISSIKNSLRALNLGASADNGDALNSLKVSVHKVKFNGDNETACTFKVHLSSPIEELEIGKMYDPLDPESQGGFALFQSVETSNALLTMEVYSGGEKIGVSAAHDLLPLVEDMKVVSGGDGKSLMVDFAIVAEDEEHVGDVDATESSEVKEVAEESAAADVAKEPVVAADDDVTGEDEPGVENVEARETEKSEEEEDGNNDDKFADAKEEPDDVTEEAKPAQDEGAKESKIQVPVCTLSVHLEYTPSLNDKRDALYDQLNEVSKRKAEAIESLRKSASALNRAKMEDDDKKSPAVKAGFLNKSKPASAKAPPPFWKRWYDKTIGPKSMLWVIAPVAKNYVIFFGMSAFFHYKGELSALPPPV